MRLTKDGRPLDVSLSISPISDQSGRITGASKIIRDISARRQAEEALAAANAKFESVFNQSGIFAGILDPDGTVRDINVLAIDACGYTREQVLDLPFWDTLWWRGSEEVRGRIRLAAEMAAAGEIFRETLPYWVADGSERIVDFVMHPIVDESGVVRFLHPTGIDITERVAAEKALRALEAEEREIAIGLQRALLPTRLAERSDIALAALYEAGSDVLEVGGDWYDAFELPDGRIALTVGDVVGHGLAAAAAMGQVRTALAALADHAAGPGQLLERLDGFLARSGTTDFATVCYVIIEPATGALEYASAGHPPDARRVSGGRHGLARSGAIGTAPRRRAACSTAGSNGPRTRIPARPVLGWARRAPQGAVRRQPRAARRRRPGRRRASPSRRSAARWSPSSGSSPRATMTSR